VPGSAAQSVVDTEVRVGSVTLRNPIMTASGTAGYGDELIERLARDLTARFGRGFGRSNLSQIRAFYLAYRNILQAAPGELSAGKEPEILQAAPARNPRWSRLKEHQRAEWRLLASGSADQVKNHRSDDGDGAEQKERREKVHAIRRAGGICGGLVFRERHGP
jgi:hypothetical protein